MKTFLKRYKHFLPMILYTLIYLFWFSHLEKTVTSDYQIIHMNIDDYIPFCEVFVLPYFLWFLYVPAVVIYLGFKNKEDYYRSCIFLAVGMTVFLLISTFFPNGHQLRPAVLPRDNIFSHMVAALWQTDTPTNLWPSIHVYNSLGVHFAILTNEELYSKKWLRRSSCFLCGSIILATMFLKQHSVFDVLTAFVMAAFMYVAVYYWDVVASWRTSKRRTDKRVRAGS